jgi:signal transduction histidine kinase
MKTILLADDEENLRTLVRTTLDQPGYRILETEDGTAALALARRERPDVVVLDWMMPGMTGLEVLTELRRDRATAAIPIILLTAKGQREDVAQAMANGASAYLVKPFSPLDLLAKVEELGAACDALADAARSTAHPSGTATPSPSPEVDGNAQLALYARDLARMVDAERERARELADANARLQILDQVKSDFLTFISHELRTPLALIGAFDLYEPEGDPADRARVMEIIQSGYQRLGGFVGRGLEYFDWLAGERAAASVTTDLAAVVRAAIAAVPALAAPEASCELTAPASPCPVRGDGAALGTCVRALVENAVKFSPGAVRIAVAVTVADGTVTLTVRDEGRGFPPALAQELFRPFTVLDTLHHAKGTGLSLALTAAIAEAHGGRAHAASDGLDRGATFTLILPLAADAA